MLLYLLLFSPYTQHTRTHNVYRTQKSKTIFPLFRFLYIIHNEWVCCMYEILCGCHVSEMVSTAGTQLDLEIGIAL